MAERPRDARAAPIMQLIDDLEAQITSGRRFPGSSRVTVESQVVLDLIDRLRYSIPIELEQARRVVQERQQIIVEAQEEARRIVDAARERAEYLVSDAGVLGEARQRGEERLRHAEDNSRRTRQGAERYALSVIEELENALRMHLNELDRAKGAIRESQHGAQAPTERQPQAR